MHEQSLARALLSQIERVAAGQCGLSPRVALVEVGPLAGVEPLLLESAFAAIAQERGYSNLELRLTEVRLGLRCLACHQASELEGLGFSCPLCGSQRIQFTQGDGLLLVHVDFVQQPGVS